MNKTLKRKILIITIIMIVDLLLYILLFHSGIVLPFINPSIEEYNEMQKNYSILLGDRAFRQQAIWLLAHFPIVLILKAIASSRILDAVAIVQTGVIAWLILNIRERNNKKCNEECEVRNTL